jgi:hypothetical protein
MQSGLAKITNAVGDNARFKNGMWISLTLQ